MLPTFSQSILQVAFWTGLLVIIVSFLTAIAIFLMRLIRVVHNRHEKHLLELWRPLIMQSMTEVPKSLPRVSRRDTMTFLRLWSHYQESLRGESRERLCQVAFKLGIDRIALNMLSSVSVRRRLMAIVTLGYLREKKIWEDLKRTTKSNHVLLSFTAARALLHIDATNAIPFLTQVIATRTDWPLAFVINLFKEAGADLISKPLVEMVEQAPQEHLPRLIHYLDTAHRQDYMPAIRKILKTAEDPKIIAACLRYVKDSRDLDIVRIYACHTSWIVRLHVAKVLGKIGAPEDISLLTNLLSDPEWWVRYRAAQAIAKFPSLNRDGLKKMQVQQGNTLAGEILLQVLAEEELS